MMSPAFPIGLVPAAGYARRLGSLPVSKEVFPLGVAPTAGEKGSNVEVPVDSLLEAFRTAGAETAYLVLRKGKWDVPAYLGRGDAYALSLAYVVTPPTPGVPFTIDTALPFVRDAVVLFGFPDIVFEPRDAFVQLRRRLRESNADLVLGLFPARNPAKVDMVDLDAQGDVRALVIKPARTSLTYTWLLAAWTPTFTQFLHEEVQRRREYAPMDDAEVHLGHVISAAIEAELGVTGVVLDGASYTDIGTLDALQSVLRRTASAASASVPRPGV